MVTVAVLNLCNAHNLGNIACFNYSGVYGRGVGNNSIQWVTLSLVNTKDLHQGLTPNYQFNT